jgi:hypothetical protein
MFDDDRVGGRYVDPVSMIVEHTSRLTRCA